MEYNFRQIEEKWQAVWKREKTFRTDIIHGRKKYYVLDMFPYPSGAGLHVGHPLGYIASDIVARYKRLKGFNVLHPMGFDAFGLPAEQYAIQTGQHPKITTEQNIARYRQQLDKIGFSYDWSREVITSDPSYYKWTQWIFIRLYHSWYDLKTNKALPVHSLISSFEQNGTADVKASCSNDLVFTADEWNASDEAEKQRILLNYRLAYLSEAWVNWCAALGTVLANDEVKDGVSERGGYPVERKKMPQWSLRITAYADRLLNDLEKIDWPESVREAQRNWIGKSEGTTIRFKLLNPPAEMTFGSLSENYQGPHPQPLSANYQGPLPQPLSEGEGSKKLPGEGDSEQEGLYKYKTANPSIYAHQKAFARKNRSAQTDAENILWQQLRNKQTGFQFRRQHPIDNYIVDFICISKRLIIEVDGEIHQSIDQKLIDENRTFVLNDLGYTVLRFSNQKIINDVEIVISSITDALSKLPFRPEDLSSPSLSERGPGGVAFTQADSENLSFEDETQSGEADDQKRHVPSAMPQTAGGVKDACTADFIEVFTTRPDTIFGVSYLALAPEHELVQQITTAQYRDAVMQYVDMAKNRSERERQSEVKRITGELTGAYAIHPFTGEKIPVWIADYVLAGYGTGAVMAVPAHDSRDHAFAKHFGLPIIKVVEAPAGNTDTANESYDDKEGKVVNSGFLTGLDVKKAIRLAIDTIETKLIGKGRINYRLRDAAFGRQRYWGEPIPVYYKNGTPYTLPDEDLPLILPEVDKYQPTSTGEPPLARAAGWKYKGIYDYEHTTMPGWAGSSWYFLRYMDPHNDTCFASEEAMQYWRNADFYLGGAEHATGHLLYVRFWTKFLFDLGLIPEDEPAKKLINQGMIQGVSAFVQRINGTNTFVSDGLKDQYDTVALHVDIELAPDHILDIEKFKCWREEFNNATFILENDKYICTAEVEKMSKSKYNVVNPDDIIDQYGTDTLRLYEMFLGPLEQSKPWSTQGISGVHNFLRRTWRLFHTKENNFSVTEEAPQPAELKVLHKTIKKVEEDVERFSFNTTISTFMICVNELTDLKCRKRQILEPLVILLSPYAPHFSEELWQLLGHTESISKAVFPEWKNEYLAEDNFDYPVSINGKLRFKINLSLKMSKEEVESTVLNSEEIRKYIESAPKKIIVVPGRIVNVVI